MALKIQPYSQYDQNVLLWNYYDLTWKGGTDYREGSDPEGSEILLPWGDEKQSDDQYTTKYKKRRAITPLDNYFKMEIPRFNSYIWKMLPQRQIEEQANALGMNKVMRELSELALRMGTYFVGVDSPAIASAEKLTQAQVIEKGISPYIMLINPARVLEFDMDENGKYTRITITETYARKHSISEQAREVVNATVWYPDRWERYTKRKEGDYDLIKEGGHAFGRVPVTSLSSIFSVRDLCDKQREIFNLESQRLVSIVNLLWPLRVITGILSQDCISLSPDKSTVVITDPEGKAKVDFLESDVHQVEQLGKEKERSIREFLSMVYNDSNFDRAYGESAEKKRLDLAGLFSPLSEWAKRCQDTERELWRILLDDFDDDDVKYETEKFEVNTREQIWDNIRQNAGLAAPDYIRDQLKKIAKIDMPNDINILKQIDSLPIMTLEKAQAISISDYFSQQNIADLVGIDDTGFEENKKKTEDELTRLMNMPDPNGVTENK